MCLKRPVSAALLSICLATADVGWGADILLLSRFPPPGPNYSWPDGGLVRFLEAQGHRVDTSFMGVALGSIRFNGKLIDAVNATDVIVVSPATPIARSTCPRSKSGSDVDASGLWQVARPILRMDLLSGTTLPLTNDSTTDVIVHDPDHPFVAQLGGEVSIFDWRGAQRDVEHIWQAAITLPSGRLGPQTQVIATYDGHPFLTETPDTTGTGANRRAYLAHWNYASAGSKFDEFITADYQRILANVVRELASSDLGGGPPAYEPPTAGDLNGNGIQDAADIDLMTERILAGTSDQRFDLNGNSVVDRWDRLFLIEDVFKTWIGDANLDGQFESSDIVQAFQHGRYGTGQHAGWADGDWSGDFRFDSSDIVSAFQTGNLCEGFRGPVAEVPEPGSVAIAQLVLLLGCLRRRVKRFRPNHATWFSGGTPTGVTCFASKAALSSGPGARGARRNRA